GLLGPGARRLGAGQDVGQVVEGLDRGGELVGPALADRGGDELEALLVEALGVELDLVGDDDEGSTLLALPHVEAEVADAARDHEADVGVLEPVGAHGLEEGLLDLLERQGQGQEDGLGRLLEALEVLVEAEDASVVGADALEDAVAVEDAVVEDRDLGVVFLQHLAVYVDLHRALSAWVSRMPSAMCSTRSAWPRADSLWVTK